MDYCAFVWCSYFTKRRCHRLHNPTSRPETVSWSMFHFSSNRIYRINLHRAGDDLLLTGKPRRGGAVGSNIHSSVRPSIHPLISVKYCNPKQWHLEDPPPKRIHPHDSKNPELSSKWYSLEPKRSVVGRCVCVCVTLISGAHAFILTIVKVFMLGWFEKSSNRREAQSSGLTGRSRLVDCLCRRRISAGDFG